MINQLFRNVDYKNDPHWVVKEFFNSVYQQDKFLWALPLIIEKKGCGVNEEFCLFPDLNDPTPIYHFAGVTFGTMDDEVIITEKQCNAYIKEACDHYLEENPGEREKITNILSRVVD